MDLDSQQSMDLVAVIKNGRKRMQIHQNIMTLLENIKNLIENIRFCTENLRFLIEIIRNHKEFKEKSKPASEQKTF